VVNLEVLAPAYACVRLCAALPLNIQSWRERREVLRTLALGLTDIAGALFVLGYARPHLRTVVGGWWVPLFLLALPIEALRLRDLRDEADSEGPYQAVFGPWTMLGLVPVLGAGFFLFFDVLFPGNWGFGGGISQ
jgi:hypothetical protein